MYGKADGSDWMDEVCNNEIDEDLPPSPPCHRIVGDGGVNCGDYDGGLGGDGNGQRGLFRSVTMKSMKICRPPPSATA